jgi:glycosyltransferase involved in cell wall biosynthesis
MVAEHFLRDGLEVVLVTLLPDKPLAHALPVGLLWIDLGPHVAATWSNRAMEARAWRFLLAWSRRLLAWSALVAGWNALSRLKRGEAVVLVQWLVTSVSGVQATLLRDLLRSAQPVRVLSFLTRTNVLCCQALWGLSGHLVVSERNDPRLQRQPFPWLRLQGWLWQRADVVTANTAGVLEGLQRCHPQLAAVMRLLPNPLKLNALTSCDCNHSLSLSSPRFLAVCRLVPQKGIDLLVRAYAKLPDSIRSGWPLLIVGDGPERQALEALATSLFVKDQVLFLGFQPQPQRFYAHDAVFVLPSRFEGMPNALLEAMGAGLAVIVSDASPGPLEVVSHAESGWVVPTEQVNALATAMQHLAEEQPLRSQLGTAAAGLMEAHSWDALDDTWRDALNLRR